jgi:hypothetical protein
MAVAGAMLDPRAGSAQPLAEGPGLARNSLVEAPAAAPSRRRSRSPRISDYSAHAR